RCAHLRALPSFPTRRSSDLGGDGFAVGTEIRRRAGGVWSSPAPAPFVLLSVFTRSATDAWAVGAGVIHWDGAAWTAVDVSLPARSEEHTSELQSRGHLVCRL